MRAHPNRLGHALPETPYFAVIINRCDIDAGTVIFPGRNLRERPMELTEFLAQFIRETAVNTVHSEHQSYPPLCRDLKQRLFSLLNSGKSAVPNRNVRTG